MTNPFNLTTRAFDSTNIADFTFGMLVARGGGRTAQLDAHIEW